MTSVALTGFYRVRFVFCEPTGVQRERWSPRGVLPGPSSNSVSRFLSLVLHHLFPARSSATQDGITYQARICRGEAHGNVVQHARRSLNLSASAALAKSWARNWDWL